jgi:AP-1 complex subunit mu
MASAVFILDLKGKVLISRNYRGDIPMSAVDRFMPMLLELEEEGQTATPVLADQGVHYLYIRHNNVYCILFLECSEYIALNRIDLTQ